MDMRLPAMQTTQDVQLHSFFVSSDRWNHIMGGNRNE